MVPFPTPRSSDADPITVWFDGGCPICRREVAVYRQLAAPSSIRWVDLVDADALRHEAFTLDAALALLHVRDGDGRLRIGLDAHLCLWRQLPGWRVLAAVLLCSAWLRGIADRIYRVFTARRPGLARRRAMRHG